MAEKTVTEVAIAEAVADTEKEIFDEALGQESLEATGDNSLEQMDDDLAADAGDDADAGDQDADQGEGEQPDAKSGEVKADTTTRDEKTGQFKAEADRRVPSGRLREQTERAMRAEVERDTLKTELENFRREFDALKTGLTRPQPQQQQQQQPQKEQVPDMFADPEGYGKYMEAKAEQIATRRFATASFDDAREQHGDAFAKAYSELTQIGQAEVNQVGRSATVASILNAPNPGRALMNWHKQQATAREVGNDPNAWLEKQIEARLNDPEFQAKFLERVRGTARQNGATQTRLPPSLNGQTGGSQHAGNGDPELYNNTEESVFAFATR